MMKIWITAVALAIAALTIPTPSWAIEKCGSAKRVTCIVDGDTFWLNGEKIRAMGYDTPEPTTNVCGGAREQQLAAQASARFMELFNTSQISIERRGQDKYGRTLAVIWADGKLVGDILKSEGLARRYPDGHEFWCD